MEKKNYKVLARKYRPEKLSQIIGQEEICQIIKGSVKLNRVPHAFLFSGTRGVGKTTIARILSKIVNCENVDSNDPEPCGHCKSCISIGKESNLDVVEIDAASRTGVADVREIIENVGYKAVEVRKKIYIIDEVHMLSKAAFNALLKTLEEPPDDVIFIFATTETEKVPVTIMSRCQKFELRRIDIPVLKEFLISVSKKESFDLDNESALLISQSSEGSVRDALSILDNVLSRGKPIKFNTVKEVLGLSDSNLVYDLFKFICDGDVKSSLSKFEEIYSKGASLDILARMLMNMSFFAVKLKSGLEEDTFLLDSATVNKIKDLTKKYEIVFLTRFWELMQKYLKEIQDSFDEKQCFEMTIMRLSYVSLLPTPFEELTKLSQDLKINNEHSEQTMDPNNANSFAVQDNYESNLARQINLEQPNQKKNEDADFENQMQRFKEFVNIIEDESEMQLAFQLRNSFRLLSLQQINKEKGVGEIQLECINQKIDSKDILWRATKIIEKKINRKWIFSVSSAKGIKSIIEFENEKEQMEIENIKKNKIIKKILEIIPSSEIVSVKKLNQNN